MAPIVIGVQQALEERAPRRVAGRADFAKQQRLQGSTTHTTTYSRASFLATVSSVCEKACRRVGFAGLEFTL
jgi:hypothetical protein